MKVMFLGVKLVRFTPRGENVEKVGLSVYYTAESPDVIGLFSDSLWVDKATSPKWYDMLTGMDFIEPVPGELIYEIIPGRKSPVLMEINLDEFAG